MQKTGLKALIVAVAWLLGAAAAFAQESTDGKPVTFTNINDAVPDRFFDAASTAPDVADANILVIGLNSGRDPIIWKDREFKASLMPFSYASAADTISFVITAPDGYFISSVIYKESITLGNSRTGRAFATTQLVVNGVATEAKFVDLTDAAPTRVPMSITTSLVAANADAQVVAGRVIVNLEPRPAPPELAVVGSTEPAAAAVVEDLPVLPEAVPLEATSAADLPGTPVELPEISVEAAAPGGESGDAR